MAVNKYLDYLISLAPVLVGGVSAYGDNPVIALSGSGVGGSTDVTNVGDLTRIGNNRLPGSPGIQMFDGCVRASNIGNLSSLHNGFTVMACVRSARYGYAGWDRIMSFGTSFVNNEVIFSRSGNSNKLNLSFWNGTTATPNAAVQSNDGTLVAGSYYHVAGVYDRQENQLRLYINGVLSATASGITSMVNAPSRTNVAFCGPTSGTNAEYWNGANFLPTIFDKVLSPAEILDLANIATAERSLSGNAKYTDTSLGVSRVVGVHKASGEAIFSAVPAANGDWSAVAGADDVHIAYLGDTVYAPQVHGPY